MEKRRVDVSWNSAETEGIEVIGDGGHRDDRRWKSEERRGTDEKWNREEKP